MSALDRFYQELEDACAEYEEAVGEAKKIANELQRPRPDVSCSVEAERTTTDEDEELAQTISAQRVKLRKSEAEIKLHEMACSHIWAACELKMSGNGEAADELVNFVKRMYEKYGGKKAWESVQRKAEAVNDTDSTSRLAFLRSKQTIPKTLEEVLAAGDGSSKDVAVEQGGGHAEVNAPGGQEDAADSTAR